ncbi:copper chaperone PCu(A)C [Marinospirillum sp. MEB164]|uniref:Copper chaperone PCu(A)C n=1 Tax=Marinospirillum alkalitolerans TaxID=3123374 RepID=A0ABW8PU72_9GAMM
MNKKLAWAAGLLLSGWQVAQAEVQVFEAWSLAAPAQVTQVPVYMTLTQMGSGTERLVGIESDMAGSARIVHLQATEDELVPIQLAQVQLPQHIPVTLNSGNTFILLEDLHQPLRAGRHFNLRLHFANAPSQEVRVRVRPTTLYGDRSLDDVRSDPLQQQRPTRRSEGLDDVMTDPLIR